MNEFTQATAEKGLDVGADPALAKAVHHCIKRCGGWMQARQIFFFEGANRVAVNLPR